MLQPSGIFLSLCVPMCVYVCMCHWLITHGGVDCRSFLVNQTTQSRLTVRSSEVIHYKHHWLMPPTRSNRLRHSPYVVSHRALAPLPVPVSDNNWGRVGED